MKEEAQRIADRLEKELSNPVAVEYCYEDDVWSFWEVEERVENQRLVGTVSGEVMQKGQTEDVVACLLQEHRDRWEPPRGVKVVYKAKGFRKKVS